MLESLKIFGSAVQDFFTTGVARFIVLVSLLLAMLVGITACSTIRGVFSNPEQTVAVRVVVTVSVMDLIAKHPEYKPRILAITQNVRSYINAEPEAKASAVIELVDSQIDYAKLSPEDGLIIKAMLVTVQSNLTQRIDNKIVDKDTVVAVGQVLDWVEAAASN